MNGRRLRGVRASRIKLEAALQQAGLNRHTQAALAQHIADLEGLESSPKDMVSRVFREQPVDPQSIERVARALGVPAHTLYLTGEIHDKHEPDAQSGQIERRSMLRLRWIFWGTAGLVLVLSLIGLRQSHSDLSCRVAALGTPAKLSPDRLGIVLARFEDDPDNRAQRFLAHRLLADPALESALSVLTLCDRYRDSTPGDSRAHLAAVRTAARNRLLQTGAHVLLWGRRQGSVLVVKLVTTRTDISPVTVELGGKPLRVDERYLEIPLDMNRPESTLPDLKKLVLQLMDLKDEILAAKRDEAVRQYQSSIEWLKASILADRNLRNSLQPEIDPTRWALVNAQLCYKYRLLGDYDASEGDYRAAIDACQAVLDVRPRKAFPADWAATRTNLGAAWLRLFAYAETREEARRRLRRALGELETAAAVIDKQQTPQLWGVNRRTLGTIYIRLGELSAESDASTAFEQGVAELKAALDVQQPELQPLDWALTQQNICLALYQHGARLGRDGIALVRQAVDHCEEAARWLSPEQSALSWAMVQNNIAASKAVLAQLEQNPEDLARAADAFHKAQQIYTRDRVPVNWAEAQMNLGELYCNLALLEQEPRKLEEATTYVESALEVFITRGVKHYQRYGEGLLAAIDACDRENLAGCKCTP